MCEMEKLIRIQNKDIRYRLRRSSRARTVSLGVHCDGAITLTLPLRAAESLGERFLKQKADWLLKKLSFYEQFTHTGLARLGRRDYLAHKEEARALVHARVAYFNARYGYAYNAIAIKNQKRAWGSCSNKKNLNFNYKLLFLPEALRDYIIVHELCHLAEMNHSSRFWQLVAQEVPAYKEIRKELKRIL